MAAIDPSAEPQIDEDNKIPRATLKLIRVPTDFDDEEDDDSDYDPEDVEALAARLREAGALPEIETDSEEEDDDSEVEKNGGPSDPVKAKKAKQAALSKKLKEDLEADEMELDGVANGVNGKGKAKITDDDDISEDSEDDEDDFEEEPEELVLCTLDPEKVRMQSFFFTTNASNTCPALPTDIEHHCSRGRGSISGCQRNP